MAHVLNGRDWFVAEVDGMDEGVEIAGEIIRCGQKFKPNLSDRIAMGEFDLVTPGEINKSIFGIVDFISGRVHCMEGNKNAFILEGEDGYRAVGTADKDKIMIETSAKDEIGNVKAESAAFVLWLMRTADMPSTQKWLGMIPTYRDDGTVFKSILENLMDTMLIETRKKPFMYEFEEDPCSVEVAFSKMDGMYPIALPESFSSFCEERDGKYYLPCIEKKASEKKPEKVDTLWEDIKAGKYRRFEKFFPGKIILPLNFLNTFVPTKEFWANFRRIYASLCDAAGIKNKFANGFLNGKEGEPKESIYDCCNVANLAWVGPPGTGKTYLASALGAALGIPVYNSTGSQDTEEVDFRSRTEVGENGLRSSPTPFFKCFTEGGINVLNEVNLISSGINQGNADALAYPYVLGVDKAGNSIVRHPMCIMVVTMNEGTEGTRRQNTAFYNRFSYWTEFNAADEEIAVQKAKSQLPKTLMDQEEKIMELLHDFYSLCVRMKNEVAEHMPDVPDILNVIGDRTMAAFIKDILINGSTLNDSITSSLLNPVMSVIREQTDDETADNFYTEVISPIALEYAGE